MNILKTQDNNYYSFRLWAKIVAIVVTITLATTMVPLSKTQLAFADEQNTTEQSGPEISEGISEEEPDPQPEEPSPDPDQPQDQPKEQEQKNPEVMDASNPDLYSSSSSSPSASSPTQESSSTSNGESTALLSSVSETIEEIIPVALSMVANPANAISEASGVVDGFKASVAQVEGAAGAIEDQDDKELAELNKQYYFYVGDDASKLGDYVLVDANFTTDFYSRPNPKDAQKFLCEGLTITGISDIKIPEGSQGKLKTLVVPAQLYTKNPVSTTESSSDQESKFSLQKVLNINDNVFQKIEDKDLLKDVDQIIFAQPAETSEVGTDQGYAAVEYLNIGKSSFSGSSIKKVIGDRDVTLQQGSFEQCENLSYVNFSKNINNVGESAFKNCSALNEVYWQNVTTSQYSTYSTVFSESVFGADVFYGCAALTKICIPQGISIVNTNAFRGCPALIEVVFPESIAPTEITMAVQYNIFGDDTSEIKTLNVEKIYILANRLNLTDESFSIPQGSKQYTIYTRAGSVILRETTDKGLKSTYVENEYKYAKSKYTTLSDSGSTTLKDKLNLGYKEISTITDLKNFAVEAEDNPNIKGQVLCDIDAGKTSLSENFTTIDKFRGEIDGGGHVIKNLKQNRQHNQWGMSLGAGLGVGLATGFATGAIAGGILLAFPAIGVIAAIGIVVLAAILPIFIT